MDSKSIIAIIFILLGLAFFGMMVNPDRTPEYCPDSPYRYTDTGEPACPIQ